MLKVLRLLAPALMPSWNFFDVIADSPRVEFARPASEVDEAMDWREFRPRPAHVGLGTMAGRMLWNAWWNEALFVMSCAERLIYTPTPHSEDEIFRRIAADIADADGPGGDWLVFRIVLLGETEGGLARETAFTAAPRRLDGIAIR